MVTTEAEDAGLVRLSTGLGKAATRSSPVAAKYCTDPKRPHIAPSSSLKADAVFYVYHWLTKLENRPTRSPVRFPPVHKRDDLLARVTNSLISIAAQSNQAEKDPVRIKNARFTNGSA